MEGEEDFPLCDPRGQAHHRTRSGSLYPAAVGEGSEGGAEKGVWVPFSVGGGRAGATAPFWRAPSDWAPHLCSAQWSHTRSLSRLGSQFPGLSVGPCLGLPWWPEGSAIGVTGPG